MTTTAWVLGSATALLAVGTWLLLPRGKSRGRRVGALLWLIGLVLLSSQAPRLAQWGPEGGWGDDLGDVVFLSLAFVTVVSAMATVSLRSPVYCAIWFALSLLGTAGLFLYQGSQFLGVATIVVYAGAILVTFLFVLMLAQPEGHAYYDRLSWEGLLSAACGAVLVGVLTMTLLGVHEQASVAPGGPRGPSAAARKADILASEHVARLGARLFSRHLLAVEVAGTLLLVALVGAVAIVAERDLRRPAGPQPGDQR